MKKYTLFELQQYLHRVISLNFPEPVWVTAEVSQVKSSRGHLYLDLVQKKEGDQGQVCAQSQGVIWAKNLRKIASSLPMEVTDLLEAGREMSILAEVSFHAVYGLKLSVLDIDLNYTLGQIALLREQTMQQLRKEGLLEKNQQIELPEVLQRIAVISSSNAAGYQDFMTHLEENEPGYAFAPTLFSTALQGVNLAGEVQDCLHKINGLSSRYDCIVIIRGGGSKLDLAGFDQYEVAKAIAGSKLPVLTGIGHEIDQTITDIVAHRAFKTPTAVANYIIDHNTTFENKIWQLDLAVHRRITQIHKGQIELLNYRAQGFYSKALNLIMLESQGLRNKQKVIGTCRDYCLGRERQKLDHLREKIGILQPEAMFKRGYSLTFTDTRPLRSIRNLAGGELVTTRLGDGSFRSRIETIEAL